MSLLFDQGVIRFDGHCAVEEAMTLLEIFQVAPDAAVDLGNCDGMHAALLQVMVAARPHILSLPVERLLADLVTRMVGEPA
jgi:hypothetical protein